MKVAPKMTQFISFKKLGGSVLISPAQSGETATVPSRPVSVD